MNETLRIWERLEEQVATAVQGFPGVAGIALSRLSDDLSLQVNGDEIFPTASTIKMHILTRLLMRAEAGEIDLQQRVPLDRADPVLGSGVLAYLDGPLELTLLDLANLMIIASDNLATNLCIDQAGLEGTNRMIRELGLRHTRLARKMMDQLAAVREQENVSTPAELVAFLRLLHQERPSRRVARQVLAILSKPKYGFLERALPPGIPLANKPGHVDGARCDAGLVTLSRSGYAIAIMTKFTLCDDLEHEGFLIRLARSVHQTLAVLDASNRYGRTVY